MAVGGSGGHFSPEYFEYLLIPHFPEETRSRVVRLYHNDAEFPGEPLTVDGFEQWHAAWNSGLGVWQLNREMQVLRAELERVQAGILQGAHVRTPFGMGKDDHDMVNRRGPVDSVSTVIGN